VCPWMTSWLVSTSRTTAALPTTSVLKARPRAPSPKSAAPAVPTNKRLLTGPSNTSQFRIVGSTRRGRIALLIELYTVSCCGLLMQAPGALERCRARQQVSPGRPCLQYRHANQLDRWLPPPKQHTLCSPPSSLSSRVTGATTCWPSLIVSTTGQGVSCGGFRGSRWTAAPAKKHQQPPPPERARRVLSGSASRGARS
jgi:hypothetical protein